MDGEWGAYWDGVHIVIEALIEKSRCQGGALIRQGGLSPTITDHYGMVQILRVCSVT